MTGYGLSVFQGTDPERFEVEIIGVLPNALPKQDMILIRMSGAGLVEVFAETRRRKDNF